jgi:hypothetical protein
MILILSTESFFRPEERRILSGNRSSFLELKNRTDIIVA